MFSVDYFTEERNYFLFQNKKWASQKKMLFWRVKRRVKISSKRATLNQLWFYQWCRFFQKKRKVNFCNSFYVMRNYYSDVKIIQRWSQSPFIPCCILIYRLLSLFYFQNAVWGFLAKYWPRLHLIVNYNVLKETIRYIPPFPSISKNNDIGKNGIMSRSLFCFRLSIEVPPVLRFPKSPVLIG